jgi:hypothetical protein
MNYEKIKKVLEEAQHELTTLHNLTVTDNVESGVTWVTDASQVLMLIDEILSEL